MVPTQICLLLPVDSRLACAAVCRPWRAALAERCLWTHLDLSPASGVLKRQSGVLEGKKILRDSVGRGQTGF